MRLIDLRNYEALSGIVFFRLWICIGCLGWPNSGISREGRGNPIQLVLDQTKSSNIGEKSVIQYLHGSGDQDQVNEIWVSSDFENWDLWRITHHNPFELKDLPAKVEGEVSSLFFRTESYALEQAKPWKNLVRVPGYVPELERYLEERFLSFPISYSFQPVSWIKFAIRWSEEGNQEVVFQNSKDYSFHYDFLGENLAELRNANREEMDEITLFNEGRTLLLGAALFSIHASTREVGIQFVSQDPLSVADTERAFRAVKGSIHSIEPVDFYYMPTFQQLTFAEANRTELEANGIPIASTDRWSAGAGIYSPGWAMGRLVYLDSSEIDAAFLDGTLTSDDILVTDGTPAEIPRVAGVITLSPSSPSSHTAILASSYKIPFAYLRSELQKKQVLELLGQSVYFSANEGFAFNQSDPTRIRLIPLAPFEGTQELQDLSELKDPDPLQYPVRQSAGTYWKNVSDLTYSDLPAFGGKSTYFHLLRRAIPQNSPEAVALSLDLWNDYMNQIMLSGMSLRETIEQRLASLDDTSHPSLELKLALDEIQNWIKDDADFTASQQASILDALSSFDNQRKIRFRSSTNVEDTETFVGAGLYSSYSGCKFDDLDDDDAGPSGCDDSETKERGVFRAIRKVYASFYNLNAYLERSRRGVTESEVGMGVLAHYSFPDEMEIANGVVQVERLSMGSYEMVISSQIGAVSVSNPDPGVEPEQVRGYRFSATSKFYLSLDRQSSLAVLGAKVMTWESDYEALSNLIQLVMAQYQKDFPEKLEFKLDFEFKKTPEGLSVKQVRPLPVVDPNTQETQPIWLQPSTYTYATFQEEMGEIFGMHRSKSRWRFTTNPITLGSQAPSESPWTSLQVDYVANDEVVTWEGAPQDLQNFEYSPGRSSRKLPFSWSWDVHHGAEVSLEISNFPEMVRSDLDPVVTLDDSFMVLMLVHDEPQIMALYDGISKGREDVTVMRRDFSKEDVPALAIMKTREAKSVDENIEITIQFYWPPEPAGAVAGYTAPLLAWDETTISGVPGLSSTIRLSGFFSQTYHPGHHNFWEEFVLDPFLEPGIDEATLDQFRAANVRMIYVTFGLSSGPDFKPQVYFISPDGKVRQNWSE